MWLIRKKVLAIQPGGESLISRDPHGGRREPILQNYPLTLDSCGAITRSHHTHTVIIKRIELNLVNW